MSSVFSNLQKTSNDLLEKCPLTIAELHKVQGLTDKKVKKFGVCLIAMIQNWAHERNLIADPRPDPVDWSLLDKADKADKKPAKKYQKQNPVPIRAGAGG